MQSTADIIKNLRNFCTVLALFVIPIVVAACVRELPQPTATPVKTISVDPVFKNYYEFLGGKDTLGDVISPLFEKDGVSYQYTVGALMVFDPKAKVSQRYHLAPIGLAMDVSEPSVPKPEDEGELYVGGHVIYPKFVPMYEKMGGVQVVGRPLTEARYNEDRNRIEQLFENVGFYLADDDPSEPVRLLAYGAWECDADCRSSPPLNAVIDFPHQAVLPIEEGRSFYNFFIPYLFNESQPGISARKAGECCVINLPLVPRSLPVAKLLTNAVARLGADLTGYALTGVYLTPEGNLEQIYENVVIDVDPQKPDDASLIPLPERLKITPDPLEKASDDPTMYFYPVQGDEGYNVASYFLYYLNLHGGLKVSGPPITKYDLLEDNVYWQCFENLCLEEHQGTPDGLIIRPVGLGYMYKEQADQSLNRKVEETQPPKELSLQVWESNPRVASNQEQEIEVSVQENNVPLENLEPTLTLTLPDGTTQAYTFPPTSKEGRTQLTLPPISASNGTLIAYQICIRHQAEEKFCVKDDYLIWNIIQR